MRMPYQLAVKGKMVNLFEENIPYPKANPA